MIKKIKNKFKKMKREDKIVYALLGILLITATILRFYNFPFRYGLGEESVRDALIGIEGARQLQFPLTGAFSSLGPFTFGAWYQYQMILASILLPFSYAPWIYLSIISVLYVAIMYKIGESLVNKNFGLILACVATFSPAQVISATHLTSHNMTNLFAALAFLLFLLLAKKNYSYWMGYALGFVIGVGMNLHFQMSGLLILPLLLLIHKPKKFMYFVTASAGAMSTFLPLLLFEMNNHWFNTRNLTYYLLEGKNTMYVPNRWLWYIRDFWPEFWADALGIPPLLAALIMVVSGAIIVRFIIRRKISIVMVLLLVAFAVNFIWLRYYWGPKFFGYLNFFRPFIFIFTGFTILTFLNNKYTKYLGFLLLFALIVLSWPRNMSQMEKDSFTMEMYTNVNELEKKYPQEKFQVWGCTKEYKASYNAKAFSILFLLDMKKKLSENGVKIAVATDCSYPPGVFPNIENSNLVDLSNASKPALVKYKWSTISTSGLYDNYARWWFKEQP